ncbi:MAG: 4-hydroxy-tetrahydrodipicolinate synthase [Promethearchaeota archaeon]
MRIELKGSIPALITPFTSDLDIDEDSLRSLVDFHIKNGSDALVACATTGESATMTHSEHHKVMEIVVDQVNGRIPVIAGAGSNSTNEAISLTNHAENIGADAVLSVTPYYNRPTQEGLIQHFTMIAEKTNIPIIIYNVPSRTGINMEGDTTVQLSKIDNIIGIKEASGNLNQITEIILGTKDNPNFKVLSGDDLLTYHICALGGAGIISVAANIIPDRMSGFLEVCLNMNYKIALSYHLDLYPLFKALSFETNPGPVKFIAFKLKTAGISNWFLRPPLVMPTEHNQKRIEKIIRDMNLN